MRRDGQVRPDIFEDLKTSSQNPGFWIYSAWLEIVLAYRATFLGPLWMIVMITISVAILGGVYSAVLGVAEPSYFVYIAMGLIVWAYMSGIIQSSCRLFQSNKSFLLNGNSVPTDFVLKLVVSSLVMLAHQAVVALALMLVIIGIPSWLSLLSLVGLALLVINAVWVAAVVAIFGSRVYDLNEIVGAFLKIAFLVTPIIWPSHGAKAERLWAIININPFYHFIEVTRGPLLGVAPSLTNWIVVLGVTAFGWLAAWWSYRRYIALVPLWI